MMKWDRESSKQEGFVIDGSDVRGTVRMDGCPLTQDELDRGARMYETLNHTMGGKAAQTYVRGLSADDFRVLHDMSHIVTGDAFATSERQLLTDAACSTFADMQIQVCAEAKRRDGIPETDDYWTVAGSLLASALKSRKGTAAGDGFMQAYLQHKSHTLPKMLLDRINAHLGTKKKTLGLGFSPSDSPWTQ